MVRLSLLRATIGVWTVVGALVGGCDGFVPAPGTGLGTTRNRFGVVGSMVSTSKWWSTSTSLSMSTDDELSDASSLSVRERIERLVSDHPVLLFMKGTKIFPQCGFSNTAVQILNAYGLDFHTVDVLADESIRQGIKDYSQWPTIPQLYVAGEFIGGSDIMIEMYQSGELAETIEKAKADMM